MNRNDEPQLVPTKRNSSRVDARERAAMRPPVVSRTRSPIVSNNDQRQSIVK